MKIKTQLFLCALLSLSCVNKLASANIIFDLGGVFFKPNKLRGVKLIGYRNILSNLLLLNNPFNFEKRYFEILKTIPVSFSQPDEATYLGKQLPPIMCAWMRNQIPWQTIIDTVFNTIEAQDMWQWEKDLFHAITFITFEPTFNASIMDPIQVAIDLARECYEAQDAQGNKKHKLFLLSNYNKDAYLVLARLFPEFFGMFEESNRFISGELGDMKPDETVYKKLLEVSNIKPEIEPTYFVDDQHENLLTAGALGIRPIHCKNPSRLRNQFFLENLVD